MPLPTFIIIGAQKSGTTSLYHYLAQHPQVSMSAVKEPNFFAFEGQEVNFRGPGGKPASLNAYSVTRSAEYEQLFKTTAGATAFGEASTLYLAVPGTAERMYHHIPDVRLIAILRNPVDRAYSSFLHCRRSGREPLASFSAALAAEQERISDRWGYLWRYETLGYYHEQLVPYFATFPREQMLVVLSDDLIQQPQLLLTRVLKHIGVDPTIRLDSSERHNVSGEPKSVRLQRLAEMSNPLKTLVKPIVPEWLRARMHGLVQRHNLTKPPMPSDAGAYLEARFRDDIIRLSALTELDLSRWLPGEAS